MIEVLEKTLGIVSVAEKQAITKPLRATSIKLPLDVSGGWVLSFNVFPRQIYTFWSQTNEATLNCSEYPI